MDKSAQRAPLSDHEFEEFYEIESTAKCIEALKSKKVALQLPGNMLHDALRLSRAITQRTGVVPLILGDNVYSSCCPDELGAQHAGADLLVHYGNACMSRNIGVQVQYVFGRRSLDVNKLADAVYANRNLLLEDNSSHTVLLSYDLAYAHLATDMAHALRTHHSQTRADSQSESLTVLVAELDRSIGVVQTCAHEQKVSESKHGRQSGCCGASESPCGCQRLQASANTIPSSTSSSSSVPSSSSASSSPSFTSSPSSATSARIPFVNGLSFPLSQPTNHIDLDTSKLTILHVGSEGPLLNNIQLTFGSKHKILQYQPEAGTISEPSSLNRLLMRRYYLVQKAKDAEIIGIVAGTVGLEHSLDAINYLSHLIREAGKKPYVISVGRIEESKLANFTDVDIFVLVACPFASLIDTSNFVKDIVTPFELELALKPGREWGADYSTTFQDILPGVGALAAKWAKDDQQSDGHAASEDEAPQYSLVSGKLRTSRPAGEGLVASERFKERQFQGLTQSEQERVSGLHEGRAGTAWKYDSEPATR